MAAASESYGQFRKSGRAQRELQLVRNLKCKTGLQVPQGGSTEQPNGSQSDGQKGWSDSRAGSLRCNEWPQKSFSRVWPCPHMSEPNRIPERRSAGSDPARRAPPSGSIRDRRDRRRSPWSSSARPPRKPFGLGPKSYSNVISS